jgi:gas vesicle protein
MPRPDRIMENNKNNNHNGSGNGFLLGVIVGVLATLLFTTKRGRIILKDVMEKGIDKFANLEELMRETEEEYDDADLEDETGDDFVPTVPVAPEQPKVEKKPADEVLSQPAPIEEAPKPGKDLEPEPAEIVKEEKDETVGQAPVEEKPKTTRVKRLFRGLRKKS